MTANYLPTTPAALAQQLADSVFRGDESPEAAGFKQAGVASRERTVALVVKRAVSESEEGR